MTKQEILDSIHFEECNVRSEKVGLSYGGIARALYPGVDWFFDKQEGDYSGDWYMVGKDEEGRYYFFAMGYGSCPGCDWLEDALGSSPEKSKEKMAEIIDSIQNTPVLENKEAALEYAKKFDWQNDFDRDAHNPLVKEVVEAIEKS